MTTLTDLLRGAGAGKIAAVCAISGFRTPARAYANLITPCGLRHHACRFGKNRYAAVRRVTGIGRLLSVIMAVENYSSSHAVEEIMPSSITQLVIGTVVAIGMAVAGVSAIGSAVAFERNASEILINRLESPLLEEGTRSVDRERLRAYFFDERGRLR